MINFKKISIKMEPLQAKRIVFFDSDVEPIPMGRMKYLTGGDGPIFTRPLHKRYEAMPAVPGVPNTVDFKIILPIPNMIPNFN